jgi:hypothetical protein
MVSAAASRLNSEADSVKARAPSHMAPIRQGPAWRSMRRNCKEMGWV